MFCFYLRWYDTSAGIVLEVTLKAKLSYFILTVFLPLEDYTFSWAKIKQIKNKQLLEHQNSIVTEESDLV